MTRNELERKLESLKRDAARLERAIGRLTKLAQWARGVGLKALASWLGKRRDLIRARRVDVLSEVEDVRDRLKQLGDLPDWLPSKFAEAWSKPWLVSADPSSATEFKSLLWGHGLVSPHYTRREAGGQDRNPLGCAVPESLRANAQRHAFTLERVRHELGDRPLGPLSWYRCPPHNSSVGGASASQHLQASATDWSDATRASAGGDRFDEAMERAFSNGGRGYQGAVGGPIRHVDNGPARTWVYA